MILDRYFAYRFAVIFAGVLGIFTLLIGFVGLVDLLRRFSGTEATFAQLFNLAVLDTPQGVYRIMPLIVIITTITLFLGLARTSEMVVTRAAGRSALRALVPPVIMALIVGILGVAILNPIVAATSRQFEVQSGALSGEESILSLSESGLWLRQGNAQGQTVIRAERANLSGTELIGVTFISFAPDAGPVSRISADTATLTGGAWELTGVKRWPLGRDITPEAQAETFDTLSVPSTLTPDQIRDSFGTPASIPIWDLPAFIERLQAAGFSAQRHSVWFQIELAQPLFLVAMVLIGASFTLRHQRGGRTGLMVLFAILLSFAIYFLRNFAQILGENGDLPAVLAAWAPPLAAIGIAFGFLLHQEDG